MGHEMGVSDGERKLWIDTDPHNLHLRRIAEIKMKTWKRERERERKRERVENRER